MAWLCVGDKKEGKGLKEMSPERFFTLREPKLLRCPPNSGDAYKRWKRTWWLFRGCKVAIEKRSF
jgi:hypothetical protein